MMIPALILILSAVAYRIAAGFLIHSGTALWLSNFAPLAAIALCGAAYFPARKATRVHPVEIIRGAS